LVGGGLQFVAFVVIVFVALLVGGSACCACTFPLDGRNVSVKQGRVAQTAFNGVIQ
jgi:hypothetical protein